MKNSYYSLFIAGLILLATVRTYSQQRSYNQTEPFLKANAFWAWYDNNGLEVLNSPPVHTPTSMVNPTSGWDFAEGVASVSDPITGELLFYTDGHTVWNRNHNVMPNGNDLKGNWRVTTIQGACIVPVIGIPEQYYVFSLGAQDSYLQDPDKSGLYYNIVDMSRDSGRGDILIDSKNIVVDTARRFVEGMIAIPGNDCNVWLVLHQFNPDWLTDSTSTFGKNYLVYEISQNGVNSNPVISLGLTGVLSGHNPMTISPDRSKIFLSDLMPVADYIELMGSNALSYPEIVSFNVDNGTVSGGIPVPPATDHSYTHAAFSPNSDVLYVSQTNRFSPNYLNLNLNVTLLQMDASNLDSLAINTSAIIIDTLPVDPSIDRPASLKLYNDSLFVAYANSNLIGKVNNPNLLGVSCEFQPNSILLPVPYKTDQVSAELPSEVVFPYAVTNSVIMDTAVCGGILLRPDGLASNGVYSWSDGGVDTTLFVETPGVYWVSYDWFEGNCIYRTVDTFIVRPGDLAVFPEITVNVDTLSTGVPYATYQWIFNGDIINGATSSKYVVTENGEYQVIVGDEWGCTDTSDIYEVLNVSIKSLGESAGVYIYPNPTSETITIRAKEAIQYSLYQLDGRMLVHNKQSNRVDLSGFSDGMYLLKVSDQSGRVVHYERVSKVSR